eukprot:gene4060-18289_t
MSAAPITSCSRIRQRRARKGAELVRGERAGALPGLDIDSCFFRDDDASHGGNPPSYPAVNWKQRKVISMVECVDGKDLQHYREDR